jgi:hypothetical protein
MDLDKIYDLIDEAYDKQPLPSKHVQNACNHSETGEIEGTTVCILCGYELSYSPVYVRSYNQVSSHRRQPLYSRQKRFFQYVLSLQNENIGQHMEEILQLFATIEFYWNIFGNPVRKYFFNRNVTFFYIAKFLNLSISPRTLKDKDRVEQQLADIEKLLDRNTLY